MKPDHPAIIEHLRERIASADEHSTSADELCATLIGRALVKTLGVRGERVGYDDRGEVRLYTVGEVRRILANYDARIAQEDALWTKRPKDFKKALQNEANSRQL